MTQDRPLEERNGKGEDVSEAADQLTAAERKRRMARRRLLLGGAAALPMILTVKQAHAADTWTQCLDRFGLLGTIFSQETALRNAFGSFATIIPACDDGIDQMMAPTGFTSTDLEQDPTLVQQIAEDPEMRQQLEQGIRDLMDGVE